MEAEPSAQTLWCRQRTGGGGNTLPDPLCLKDFLFHTCHSNVSAQGVVSLKARQFRDVHKSSFFPSAPPM